MERARTSQNPLSQPELGVTQQESEFRSERIPMKRLSRVVPNLTPTTRVRSCFGSIRNSPVLPDRLLRFAHSTRGLTPQRLPARTLSVEMASHVPNSKPKPSPRPRRFNKESPRGGPAERSTLGSGSTAPRKCKICDGFQRSPMKRPKKVQSLDRHGCNVRTYGFA